MLTELEVKNAKPREKSYSLADGDGLILLVQESGAKSWVLRYRLDGREKRAGLGGYPETSLAEARELKMAFKRELAFGGNPQARKKAEREEANRLKEIKCTTFAKVAEEWYGLNNKRWSNSYRCNIRYHLDAYLFPVIGDRPIREIATREILNLLLELKTKPGTARHCKLAASSVFQFAVERGKADFNIVLNLGNALHLPPKRHNSALTAPKDVADLMARFEAYPGTPTVRAALWFSLYTFQRPGEIRGARWEEIDFESALWRIPAERMKNHRPHVVPLCRQVLELLRKRAELTGGSPFVFPAIRSPNELMGKGAIRSALRSMGYTNEQMTGHGFRTTASTNLNEQGWNSDIIELSLAHVEGNRVRGAYNRAERLAERREMMQAWADWLDGLRNKG